MEAVITTKGTGVPRERALVRLADTVSPFGPGGRLKLGEPDSPLAQAVQGGAQVGKTVAEPTVVATTPGAQPKTSETTITAEEKIEMFRMVRERLITKAGDATTDFAEREKIVDLFIRTQDRESILMLLAELAVKKSDSQEEINRTTLVSRIVDNISRIFGIMEAYDLIAGVKIRNGSSTMDADQHYRIQEQLVHLLCDETFPIKVAFEKLEGIRGKLESGEDLSKVDKRIREILEGVFPEA